MIVQPREPQYAATNGRVVGMRAMVHQLTEDDAEEGTRTHKVWQTSPCPTTPTMGKL